MFKQADNSVVIEGLLSELDLNYGSYVRDGKTREMISGVVTIRVNHDGEILEIPVHVFANKITNAGKPNPAFSNLETAMKTYKSIAAVGEDQADGVRMTGARITMNEYFSNQDGHLISFPRITGSFINRVNRSDINYRASFEIVMVIANLSSETDAAGVETGRLKIGAYVPKFGNSVDLVTFFAENQGVIDVIEQYWEVGATVKAIGRLMFTARTEKVQSAVDFGEPVVSTRTIRANDLIITGGAQLPLEGEFAYSEEDIAEGLATRETQLENLKARTQRPAAPAKKAPMASKYGF